MPVFVPSNLRKDIDKINEKTLALLDGVSDTGHGSMFKMALKPYLMFGCQNRIGAAKAVNKLVNEAAVADDLLDYIDLSSIQRKLGFGLDVDAMMDALGCNPYLSTMDGYS